MNSTGLRSKSGCFSCKRRRKKCDESKPTCARCAKSGLECRYIRPPEETKLRTKTQFIYESPMMGDSSMGPSHSVAARSLPSPPPTVEIMDINANINLANELYFPFVPPSSGSPLDFALPNDNTWHPALIRPAFQYQRTGQTLDQLIAHPDQVTDQLALVLSPNELGTLYPSPSASRVSRPPSDISTASMTAGQASLFQALLSLARPEDQLVLSAFGDTTIDPEQSGLPSPKSSGDGTESVASVEEEHELEVVARNLCVTPTLARNAESNTLAFVLQSYARWFASTVYDPLRIAQQAKQNIVRQITNSEPTRARVILVANAFRMLGSTVDLNARGASLLTMLRTEVHQDLSLFKEKSPATEREKDMAAACKILENILEVVSVHFYTSPLPVVMALLQATAPVFRRACPEPPEQLVNLPRMLIEPGLYRRYFAVMDVGLSVVTNRPQLFRYDVSYTADVRERMIKLDYTTDYGLEWLYGIPDRFILLLAWINGLREDFYGREVDLEIVARVEEQIRNERVGQNLHTASDSDPVFRIRRLVVQEVWRQVVYIYLYMALCGAKASDARVEKAFSIMMRLIRETKPARNPDAFLFIPMLACGVAARNERDLWSALSLVDEEDFWGSLPTSTELNARFVAEAASQNEVAHKLNSSFVVIESWVHCEASSWNGTRIPCVTIFRLRPSIRCRSSSIPLKNRDLRASKGPKDIDVLRGATASAIDLIGEIGFGYSFNSLKEEYNQYSNSVQDVTQSLIQIGPLIQLLPYIQRLGTPNFRRWMLEVAPFNAIQKLRRAIDFQNEQADKIILDRQKLISSGADMSSEVGRGRDIVTLFMRTEETQDFKLSTDREVLVGHMNVFIAAGHESTRFVFLICRASSLICPGHRNSTAVARILDELSRHPDVQNTLRDELNCYFGKNPGGSDPKELLELPYLDGVVREVLRLHPPFTIITRVCQEDTVLPLAYPVNTPSGKFSSIPIKKGTVILINNVFFNRHEHIWGERAGEFLPERWIGKRLHEVTQTELRLPGVYSSMMTFGAGSYGCIGMKFAVMEISCVDLQFRGRAHENILMCLFAETTIAALVRKFRFRPAEKECTWVNIGMQFPYLKTDVDNSDRLPKLFLKVEEVL
ncbi:unnamed protein product [Rhizoctonia solani]|uniref:Zn(2)-C6 fungal-type domain-containing protein n=1 Tax=Rhizoctonia solani TaxID=456999 RepID=A0A8H3HNN0_9AGAM|nr:unnamed protein product [Rhizoctonia solani]